MPLKLDHPLYATTASGSVGDVGTFITKRGRHYLVPSMNNNPDGLNGGPTHTQNFAIAHTTWMRKPKVHNPSIPHGPHIRVPRWPDYWRSFLVAIITKPIRHLTLQP